MNTYAMQMGWEMKSSELAVPCRGAMEAQLEELKERLLRPMVQSVADSVLAREIAWAANEAAAMAWYTACPILVLPALLEEKVLEAMKKWHKREQLLHPQAKC